MAERKIWDVKKMLKNGYSEEHKCQDSQIFLDIQF